MGVRSSERQAVTGDVKDVLYNLRSDDLARTTPCGEAVENHESILLLESVIESTLAV